MRSTWSPRLFSLSDARSELGPLQSSSCTRIGATDVWLEDYEGPQLRMLKLAARTAVAASRLPRLPAPPSC